MLMPVGLFGSACIDEGDEFDDDVELRPAQSACPPCFVGGKKVYLGISTAYNPSSIANVSLLISNSGGSELINFGSSVTIPNDPNTVAITDNELCTVDRTGLPPTEAYVMFEIYDGGGLITVGENIAITFTCS
ncbi:MAG TPA: hypothetical protein VK034_27395 [Enhygromyxa sp.]|nr:hypothetical protein [Enhygromyxa sp.]